MKYLKFASFILLSSFILSCGAPNGTNISGLISDAGNLSIYFDRLGADNTNEILLNVKADSDGAFSFNLPEGVKSGLYRVRAGAKSADMIFNGSEKSVEINGDLKSFANLTYSVKGAPLTEEYLNLIKSFSNKEIDINALTNMTINDLDPLVGVMVSTKVLRMSPDFLNVHKAVAQKMGAKYPDDRFSLGYRGAVTQVERQYAAKMASQKIKVGEPAPEIALPGVDGKTRKLSDLKGKVVLVDFWAAWCRPCRKANPHVVDVYNKYKSKGFDVFSVSLDGLDERGRQRLNSQEQVKMQVDRQKERWLAAIEQDKLTWDSHVSELKKWDSTATSSYGVKSIPKTFLIGRDGKIVYIDPRNNLEEQVKNFI